MVELAGRPLLEWHLAAARSAGADQIVVVRGYRGDQLHYPGVTYIDNPAFESTNMVYSLWLARAFFGDGFTLAYGDIVYNATILAALFDKSEPIAIAIDQKWRAYWEQRFDNVLADAESLRMDPSGKITEIGQKVDDLSKIQGQYIGLVHFQREGVRQFCSLLEEEEAAFHQGSPKTHPHRTFAQLYMTDILQRLINRGSSAIGMPIQGGWCEIDSVQDLAIAALHSRVEGDQLVITR